MQMETVRTGIIQTREGPEEFDLHFSFPVDLTDEDGRKWSYEGYCIGVRKNGDNIKEHHTYRSGKLHLIGSSSICPECLEERKSIKYI